MGAEDFLAPTGANLSPSATEVPTYLGIEAAGEGAGTAATRPVGEGAEDSGASSALHPWVLPIKHLSASSLNMLAVCPRQFQQRYMFGRKEAPSQAQVVGSSFHKTMEYNFRQKIDTLEDLSVDTLVEYLHDEAWGSVIEDVQEDTGETVVWDSTENIARGSSKIMVESYTKQTAPSIVPVKVEQRFETTVASVPVPLVGVIDVEDTDFVIDLKTSKRKVTSIKPAWRMQGRIYQIASPKPTQFHVVTTRGDVLPKLHIPYNMVQWASTDEWVAKLAWTANYYYTKYGDEEWPALGIIHDWRCSWCGYKSDCPAWRGT